MTVKKNTPRKPAVNRRIRIGGQLVAYDDATEEVLLQRTIVDVLKAKPGDHQNCMNSQCIKAQRNRNAFPHQVWAVSTIKSRVYIVDQISLKGENVVFQHAIRYELPKKESQLIHAHDTTATGEPGDLKLKTPRDPKGSVKRRQNAGSSFASGAGHGNTPGKPSTGQRDRPITAGPSGTGAATAAKGRAAKRTGVKGGTPKQQKLEKKGMGSESKAILDRIMWDKYRDQP